MTKKIMVFAVHPDDETLGAGGTLLKHIAAGDEVHWVIITKMSEANGFSKEAISARLEEIKKAAAAYGFKKTHQLSFDTMKLDQYPTSDLVNAFSTVVNEVKPECIYIPYAHDVHSDHKIAARILGSLTKSFRYPFVKKILAMEVLSETNFGHIDNSSTFFANYYVDISVHMTKKLDILRIFDSEMKPHPFARSYKNVESLGTIRGSEINTDFAESFQLIKTVN